MAMEYCTNAQKVAPSAANGVTVAANTTNLANSAWVEVIASAAADLVLTGIVVTPSVLANRDIEVGVGGSGAETVVGLLKCSHRDVGGGTGGPQYLPFTIPIDNVASGSRVAIRFRKNGTAAGNDLYAITYYEKPIVGTVLTTAQASKTPSDGLTPLDDTGHGVAWTWGAWVEVIASAAADLVIAGLVHSNHTGVSNAFIEVEIGIGGAGAESAITKLAVFSDLTTAGGPGVIPLFNPLDNVASGSRVAIRYRKANASTSGDWNVNIVYYEKPL